MSNEEKILELLTQMQATQAKMQADISGMKGDISGMKGDISGLQAGQAQIQATQAKMQDDITGIKVRLDYDVDVRLKTMSEDIDTIKGKLDTLDGVKELAEKTADSVDVIRAVVTQHSADITELKAVQ